MIAMGTMGRTFALVALALLSGCGSGNEEPPRGAGEEDASALDTGSGFLFDAADSGASSRDAAVGDATPATSCPLVLPKPGGPCVSPLECAYVGCDLSEKDRATCVAGKWSVTAAACVSSPDRCPLGIPESGTACALPDHTGCLWSTDCVGNVNGWCVGGKWSLKPGSCVAAEGCPPTLPTEGTTCTKSSGGCVYLNDCGVPQHSNCIDGRWIGKPIGCTLDPECPPTEPPNGSSCTPGSRPMCVWKNDCGGVDYGKCGWILGEGKWTIFRPPCPAATCPDTPPTSGACSKEGQSCTYPAGRGCTLKCSCTSGSWGCANDCGG